MSDGLSARLCRAVAGAMAVLGCLWSLSSAAVTITVRTTDCQGEQGVASFESTRLHKIQSAACADPVDPTQKLKQILLISDSDLTRYELLTVTAAESDRVLDRMGNIGDAELDRLNRPDVIIENRLPPSPAPPESSSSSRTPTQPDPAIRAVLPPPVVALADPPILPTPRSSTSVIISDDVANRLIVGTARTDAGLFSLTINGEAQTFSGEGLFSATIPIERSRTPVSIVAVDRQGQSSSLDFTFVRETPSGVEPRKGEDVFGNYHALIIANNAYDHMDDLATPADDAKAIAGLLEAHYGFSADVRLNANRYEMLSALNDARRDLTDEDNLLIYFAGHGAYDSTNHRGHWLPVDAEHDSTANWLSTVDVTDIVNTMSARHVLVVADSCYSGSLARSQNTSLDPGMSEDLRTRWLHAIAETRSRHVLTSGGVKPVVDDGGTGHSVFANALIEVLAQGSDVIEGSVLAHRVKQLVQAHAEALMLDQTPQYAQLKQTGHEFGEFLLIRR